MRFLDCRQGRKDPSKSILDVGVEEAIKFSGFDEKMFLVRGGKYVWSKADMKLEWWTVLILLFLACVYIETWFNWYGNKQLYNIVTEVKTQLQKLVGCIGAEMSVFSLFFYCTEVLIYVIDILVFIYEFVYVIWFLLCLLFIWNICKTWSMLWLCYGCLYLDILSRINLFM